MKISYYFKNIFISLVLLSSINDLYSQKNKKNVSKQTSTAEKITFAARIVDLDGKVIKDAKVLYNYGKNQVLTNEKGDFTLFSELNSPIDIEVDGFRSKSLILSVSNPTIIVLENVELSSEEINLPLGQKTNKMYSTNFVSTLVNPNTYPDYTLGNSLQGRLAGLVSIQQNNEFGRLAPLQYVRGLSRGFGRDRALVLVDGVERDLNNIMPEEIASVEVLKDPSSKMIYGPRSANGIILITTKRGTVNHKDWDVSIDYGIHSLPNKLSFLDSYEYTQLYNEAANNDGKAINPYSQADLDGYKNSTGKFDLKYPNHDFYNDFINQNGVYRKISTTFSGGDENVKYLCFGGFVNGGGFESQMPTSKYNRLNIRGNLDFNINKYFTAYLNLGARIEFRHTASDSNEDLFTKLSTHRPNEYSYEIKNQYIAEQIGRRALPNYGSSFVVPENIYALIKSGNIKQQGNEYVSNFGLKYDFSQYISGLKASINASYDALQAYNSGRQDKYKSFTSLPTKLANGQDSLVNIVVQAAEVQDFPKALANRQSRTFSWFGDLAYQTNFDKLNYSSQLSYFYYNQLRQRDGLVADNLDVINANYSFRNNFVYDNKYLFDFTLGYMGSTKYNTGNKYLFTPAVGLGWVVSNESFLKNSTTINFLKIKANAGILGYDGTILPYSENNRYQQTAATNFNTIFGDPGSQTTVGNTLILNVANPNLKWEQSQEINIGFESTLFKKHVDFELNYFNAKRTQIVVESTSEFKTFFNNSISDNGSYSSSQSGFYPVENRGQSTMSGIDGQIRYNNLGKALNFSAGLNFNYSKTTIDKNGGVVYPAPFTSTGITSDAIFGQISNGLFLNNTQVANSPIQNFGQYQVGDISYQDSNSDNVVNEFDTRQIGNSIPRTTLGIDINLTYKRFGLYVLGVSQLGFDRMLDNSYYRQSTNGRNKYSELALDRYHPVANPNGTQPRLSTQSLTNNNIASTFWLEDASFLRIKNVELSYLLPVKKIEHVFKSVRFNVKGTNLLTFSKNKYLDAEVQNAGLLNYPVYSTFTFGVNLGI